MERLPLFPLNTVLFPGSRLPLKIFEQRYLEMLKSCLKQDRGFVVVLISKGQEVGLTPEIFSVGSYARVIDWGQLEGGLLGITVEGEKRVRINHAEGALGELLIGDVEFITDQGEPVDEHTDGLVGLLQKLQQHPLARELGMNIDYDDMDSVIWGLSSLLPFNNNEKQYLLELDDRQMRLAALRKMLGALEG